MDLFFGFLQLSFIDFSSPPPPFSIEFCLMTQAHARRHDDDDSFPHSHAPLSASFYSQNELNCGRYLGHCGLLSLSPLCRSAAATRTHCTAQNECMRGAF
jgi:hypothetical protein